MAEPYPHDRCAQEMCGNWSGDGRVCPCALLGIEGDDRPIEDGESVNHVANVAPPTTHELKVVPPYMDALLDGSKRFEVRYNDRGFQRGDRLRLREYDRGRGDHDDCELDDCSTSRYTGRAVTALIGFVYSGDPRFHGITAGYVVLSLLDVRAAS